MHPPSDLLYTPLEFGFKVLEVVPKLLQSGVVAIAASLKLVPRDLQGGDVILGIKVFLQEVAGSDPKHLVFTFIIMVQWVIIWENLASESIIFCCLIPSALGGLLSLPRFLFLI